MTRATGAARRLAALSAVSVALLAATTAPANADAAHGAERTAPAAAASPEVKQAPFDPFYRYTGRTPLARVQPGRVLARRDVQVGLPGAAALPALQVLYRTSDERGRPAAAVTTIIEPATGTAAPKLLGYMSFYDALDHKCDPSFTLRGGDPGADNQQLTDVEAGLIAHYASSGYIVTVPDFEGPTVNYLSGHEAGMSALDSVRATTAALQLPGNVPVAMTGYSGGSIASEWAAEIAPTYAPQVHLVGVAAGGVPIHLGHTLDYIDGSDSWSGVLPAAFVALGRGRGLDLQPYLSTYGATLARRVAHQCIGEFNGKYPNLKAASLVKPQYADVKRIPEVRDTINSLIMGSYPGHPSAPLFLFDGEDDGKGDGVMIYRDLQALGDQYCAQGTTVALQVVHGLDHLKAAVAFTTANDTWLASRFAGAPAQNDCASIPAGASLASLR